MKQRIAIALIALCSTIGIPIILLVMMPSNAVALRDQPTRAYISSSNSQMISLQTVTSSPIAPNSTSSSPDSQAQQLLTEAQNDVSIANTIITFTGVFVAIVATAVGIAGFFEIRGFRGIQQLRAEVEAHIQQVTAIEKQVEEQHQQVAERSDREFQMFEERIEQIAKRFEDEGEVFEEQLKQLAQRFESESQKFMEASYNFSVATEAYKNGDNIRAIEYYKRALDLQQNNIRVMERLGRTYNNLGDTKQAVHYLNEAHDIDPSNLPTLRSLALCYRYTDRNKAIEYLKGVLDKDPQDYEALDFLGLIYRDQDLIDESISYHERALPAKQHPETEFFLSILYALKGDRNRAQLMALTADRDVREKEHEGRLRAVWKLLIHSSVYIMDDNKEEALRLIQMLTPYITTRLTYEELTTHLRILLTATDHVEWIPEFMGLMELQEK